MIVIGFLELYLYIMRHRTYNIAKLERSPKAMVTSDKSSIVEKAIAEIRQRPAQRKVRQSDIRLILEPYSKEIASLIEDKYTYSEIANMLRKHGIKASMETIRRQIMITIGAEPRSRAKSSSNTSSKTNSVKKTLDKAPSKDTTSKISKHIDPSKTKSKTDPKTETKTNTTTKTDAREHAGYREDV